MNITFGIITDGSNDQRIDVIIDSIQANNIPRDKYEIIIVGNSNINRNNTRIILFDEHIKQKWITRKKNLITEYAKFDTIVYIHDYIAFADNWWQRVRPMQNFDILLTRRLNYNKRDRLFDWVAYKSKYPIIDMDGKVIRRYFDPSILASGNFNLRYEDTHNPFQYIPGGYWIAYKQFMQKYPLDERYGWAHAGINDERKIHHINNKEYVQCNQDIQWSYRVLKDGARVQLLVDTYVYSLKHKILCAWDWRY